MTAHLALAALEYAWALRLDDAQELAGRLYRYHTQPASPDARRRWPTRTSVAAFLDTPRYDTTAGLRTVSDSRWHRWRVDGRGAPSRRLHYKLYVSPTAAHVNAALRVVLDLLPRSGAFECKVGGDLHGLLRPDKLLVYFEALEDLESTAQRLTRKLAGMPAQGVPFTAALGPGHLLSWGADPPRPARGRRDDSWRGWITQCLAEGLAAQQHNDRDGAAVHRALARATHEGIDTDRWTPPLARWARA